MTAMTMRMLILAGAASALAACGGGGGGAASALVSTPPPPPPPPPPPITPIIFPNITQTTDFTTLGYEMPDGFATTPTIVGDGFSVRYDASQQVYIMDLPASLPSRIEGFNEDTDSWYGYVPGTGASVNVDILKPVATSRDPDFEFTSLAAYFAYDFFEPFAAGAVAFGTATPTAGVPTTGSATYDALIAGYAMDSDPVEGTGFLQFNFAAGTLAGSLSPVLRTATGNVSLGTYTFVNTVFSPGSTTFSGGLQTSGITSLGSFNGLFTGPAAQELMAHWRAPYKDPQTQKQSEMFGALIGRKP